MTTTFILSSEALERFENLRHPAIDAMTARFQACHGDVFARFGERGRRACREDIDFQLNFLRPVLEFGLLQPYVEYQRWFAEVLEARRIPSSHILESLDWLAEFFLERMPDAAGATIAAALRATVNELQTTASIAPSAPPEAVGQSRTEMTTALLGGDRRQAQAIVAGLLASGHSLIDLYVHLIQPTLYDIGSKWLQNQISVAQEHLATATATTVMAESFVATPLPPSSDRKALFACVEGNIHTVGLRMISDAYELAGWNVQFLGANTPNRALVEQALAWRPELVGLSIAFPHQLAAAREAISDLRRQLGENCPRILVGGSVVNRLPALASSIGADAHAVDALAAWNDARQALAGT